MTWQEQYKKDVDNAYLICGDIALYNTKEVLFVEADDIEIESIKEKVIRVITSSCPDLAVGDIFTIDSKVYEVMNTQIEKIETLLMLKDIT